eukprot:s2315_g3.t17
MPLTPQPNAWHARLHGSLREGVYFTEVLLGSPRPQRASLIVDTASWVTELTCTGCSACGKHLHPHFNLSGSATGYWLHCGSKCPGKCQKDSIGASSSCRVTWSCLRAVLWLTSQRIDAALKRSIWKALHFKGDGFATACVLCLQTEALSRVGTFPCTAAERHTWAGAWFRNKADDDLASLQEGARGAKSRNRVFSLSLGGEGGELVIGADTAHVGQWVPLQISGSSGKYGVKVEALMFNGHSIPCRGRAQLDSASTFTYLPKEAETQLRRALADFCKGQQCVPADPPAATGDEASRHCWNVQGGTASISTKRFPVLSWRLQGLEVPWPPSRYLVRYSGKRVRLCYTFRATNALPDGSQIVLGASWMVGQELLFDIDKSRLGLTKANTRANGSEPSLRHRDSPQRRRVVPRDAPSSRAVEQPGPITTTRTDLTTALSDSPAAETSSSGVSLPLPDPVLGFELETQIVEGAAGLLLLGAFVLRARRKLWRLLFNCLRGERS